MIFIYMTKTEWDRAFSIGREKFLQSLKRYDNIEPSMVMEHGKPLFDALYGLKGYIENDAKTSSQISPTTQKYISSVIIPSASKSIDSFWGTLGFMKRQGFKLITKRNKSLLNGRVSTILPTFIFGLFAGLDEVGNKDPNLFGVVDDLTNYMGEGSPLVVSVLNKIESLS